MSEHRRLVKIVWHSQLAVLVLGLGLMGYLHFNPFVSSGYWLLEKGLAFIAYLVMIATALNQKKGKKMQCLAFIGTFGWVVYLAKLAVSKQAILLVG